jgi:hypothetical protein
VLGVSSFRPQSGRPAAGKFCLAVAALLLGEVERALKGAIDGSICGDDSDTFQGRGNECAAKARVPMSRVVVRAKVTVDNVHTFHFGLPCTAAGLARIPHVSGTPQCFQGPESRSSPTSSTA